MQPEGSSNLHSLARLNPSYMPFENKKLFFKESPATVRNLKIVTKYMGHFTKDDCNHFGFVYDGKVNPTKYGSVSQRDLGLCYETFLTTNPCRLGKACLWRHKNLDESEVHWMDSIGANCVHGMKECCVSPQQPECTKWDIHVVG